MCARESREVRSSGSVSHPSGFKFTLDEADFENFAPYTFDFEANFLGVLLITVSS